MSTSGPFTNLSRRHLIKDMAKLSSFAMLAACGSKTSSLLFADNHSQPPTKRLGIIGGGMGGLATAYLCDSNWRIDLFESREKIGGHCDTIPVDYQGETLTLDLGAQFFHPDTHPLYVALLAELGLYKEDDRRHDEILEAKGSVTILPLNRIAPYFVSGAAIFTPIHAIDFAIYTRVARNLILGKGSYDTTIYDWAQSLPTTKRFKNRLLIPWLSAMIGCTLEQAHESSARSLLQTFALAFPQNFFNPAVTFNSKIGLQGNLEHMMQRCRHVNIHTSSPIQGMERTGEQWYLHTPAGRQGPFDHVVINAQPQHSKKWLADLPGSERIVSLLDRYRYFDARIVIHEDPIYVHKYRSNWSVYNAGIENGSCEGSVWLGGIHDKRQGKTVDLFKSWATRRSKEPAKILGERRFQHPLITPDVIKATRELNQWQGKNGLSFAGQHTTGIDLQESALYSATKVAKSLNPDSPRLQALEARLQKKGKTGINYDL